MNFDEIPDEDEPEYPTTAKTNHEVYPPGSQIGTAPWILASRKPYAPQRPMDAEFMLHMAGLRRQIDGGSLRSSTSTVLTSRVSWLESRTSLESTAFSECFSIGSLPPEVDFSPTPVFKDEIPKGLMPKIESSLLAAQTLKDSAANNDPHPFQSSHLSSSSSTSTLRQRYTQPPDPTGLVRRGYWNRRGDHLTPDGYLVFPPPRMQYPEELRMYPFENEGYQDHSGLFIAYVKRQELPQSLPKHGNPPERPYESVCCFLFPDGIVEQQLLIWHVLILVCDLYLNYSFKTTFTCGRNARALSAQVGCIQNGQVKVDRVRRRSPYPFPMPPPHIPVQTTTTSG